MAPNARRAFLVTGSDTGAGKTTFSCLLAAALRCGGIDVGVMKPAETGCPSDADGHLQPGDALLLREAAGSNAALDEICPYRFAEPLAPLLAARRAGVAIDVDRLAASYRRLSAAHTVTLVEGAGGLLVPLTDTVSYAELAARLGLELIVVVGSKLGCINHCLLTLRVAAASGLPVAGYVLNEVCPTADLAQQTNATLLQDLVGPALATIPHLTDWRHPPSGFSLDLAPFLPD
ncbi:MAG TPA: dethiobiotin synthase [Terriglobales bacterium]|nr:dethiobiotin synthase [Terriglobales bacterium]